MLDKNLFRESPEETISSVIRRGTQFLEPCTELIKVGERRRRLQHLSESYKAEFNSINKRYGKQVGGLKQSRNLVLEEIERLGQLDRTPEVALKLSDLQDELEEIDSVLEGSERFRAHGERKLEIEAAIFKLAPLKRDIERAEDEFKELDAAERSLLLALPNLPADDIPTGGEDAAIIEKQWSERRGFDFTPFDHVELCQRLQLVNFEAGARLSGSGFPVLTGNGAMLQRALINFMLDLHIGRHGYTEVRPPFIVRPPCAVGTGNLPKFAEQMYHVYISERGSSDPHIDGPLESGSDDPRSGPDFYLIPTAEMPVANLYREQILDNPHLPIKFCAYSPCFRVEAGSYGKDARGLTRLHQFEKVELVRIAAPEASADSLEQMAREAETVLELLALPYRRKLLPSGDMAFASAKTYDLEVYCPAEAAWREVSSISNTTDYQARRMNVRIKRGSKPEFPHLLNASGVALPRLMVALLETYQTGAGTVAVPAVLREYMRGVEEIGPPENGVPFV